MNSFYTLKVKEIITETSNSVSILFDIPLKLENEFQFIAGQYITLKKEIKGEDIRRAYSLCSSPKSNQIKVAVKAVENGIFSTYATTKLKVGDTLEVTKPEGKFILNPKPNTNYIAFAAGSGITPVLSMIKAVLESETTATFTLVYGNKTVADTIFYVELNALQTQFPTQFKLHYIFSKEHKDEALFGRIDKANVNYFVKNKYKNSIFNEAFLCGPEAMINTVLETLQENEFKKENIYYELFTPSTKEENTSQIKEGETQVTVLLDDEENTFTMQQTQTILAASLRAKLDAPYSCQGGVCSSCIAKITEGKAIMTKNQVLTDDELEEGFVLTCVAHPTTANIVVNFDEA